MSIKEVLKKDEEDRLRRKVPGVAPGVAGRNRCDLRTRSIWGSLASLVPVKVPLKERVVGLVQLGTLLSSRDLGAILTASHLDVEGLRPELAVANITVVVDGDDLGSEDVVLAGNVRWDLDCLSVAVVVEDGVGAPVTGLFLGRAGRVAALAVVDQGGLMDLEELESRLVDLGTVAVARGEISGSPAVVGAVPALFAAATAAFMVPVESDIRSSGDWSSVRRGRSVLVSNDVGVRNFIAVDGLVSPALGRPPSRRLVTGIDLARLTVAFISLASSLKLLNGSVAGNGGNEGCDKSSGLEDLGHRHNGGSLQKTARWGYCWRDNAKGYKKNDEERVFDSTWL